MFYQLLTILIAVVHLAFVLFVFVGGLLVLRWRWIMWLHIPAAVWATVVEMGGWNCPLTLAELQMRHAAAWPAYQGGFIVHYLLDPMGTPPAVQQAMGYIVLGVNLAIYFLVIGLVVRRRMLQSKKAAVGPGLVSVSPMQTQA